MCCKCGDCLVTNALNFRVWKRKVADLAELKTGHAVEDLPDMPWSQWHESGASPEGAVKIAMAHWESSQKKEEEWKCQ